MNDTNQKPHVKAKNTAELHISPIWILPILALLISGWLVVKVILESKIPITIEMRTAKGIVIGKTELKFRGISGGIVTDIVIADDLSSVVVHADVQPSVEPYLTTETLFWVVSPQISLAGVSGLETVLSGDYIALEPSSKGDSIRHFKALKTAPPAGEDEPGLRITLQAEKLGSVSEGSQLYYRQIPIGVVRYFQLSENRKSVQINALIEKQYEDLVNQSTVFWNSGGIKLSGSLSGFEIQTESLSSVLAGGISLFTPDMEAPSVEGTTLFDLHEDYDDAGVGVPVEIQFASGYDLNTDITKVKFHGIDVGHLDSIKVSSVNGNSNAVIATVIIDPSAESLLNKDTQFWLVKPTLSLSKLSNLDTLISGNYITMKVGESDVMSRDYVALEGPPPPDFNEPGLHFYLKASSKGSLSVGAPVLFKGVEVGRVANVLTANLNDGIGLHLHIKLEYSQLINSSTRFWNVSGFDISAGLGGVKVQSESIMAILRGGIAFETPNLEAVAVKDGHEFHLLDSQDGTESTINFSISMSSADNLEPGFTKIKYKGFDAGVLKKVNYDRVNNQVIAKLGLDPRFENILKENTVFWLVTPQLKASEVKGLDALMSGAYFAVQIGDGEQQKEFKLADSSPALDWNTPGLHLILNAESGGSIQPGSGIYYQDILVGSVQSVRLKEASKGVEIQIFIKPEYADRVKSHSRFWNTSGVSIKASANGINVNTGSLDSLLSGGIAFDTASNISSTLPIKNGEKFPLFISKETADQQGFSIVLNLTDETSISDGSQITYKGIKVGEVTKSKLNLESNSVELTASIQNNLRDLIRQGTRFWIAKTEFGLLRQKNIDGILSGPELRLIPGEGNIKNSFTVLTYTPVIKSRMSGLNLVLESTYLGSVSTGAPVYYRQITVGEVLGYELSTTANTVLIYINIDDRHRALVRDNSRFWNTSGIDIEAGLFSGVAIQSESLESMIAGGIAFATPEEPGVQAQPQQRFQLADEVNKDWKEWRPAINLNQQPN
ncbi:MAG: MCE family protein [Gammaproteobacteria bacterium]|nr:MCE family protein [Gammaproteobacteria bacterium]